MTGRARRGSGALALAVTSLLVALIGHADVESLAAADSAAPPPYRWALPEGVAPPPVPEDNPMSEAKVELGRRLFTDVRLSFDASTSCATCHDPNRAFTDGRARAVGASGEPHARNTPTLWNVAYNVSFTWIDQGLTRLEDQLRLPLLGTSPVEMGFGPAQAEALTRDPALGPLARAAFGAAELDVERVIHALAAYLRTLVRMDSAFDRLLYWDDRDALSTSARAGLALFFSERLGCGHCHAGPHLSGPTAEPGRAVAPVFHRTGVAGSTAAFRAPSLRFVGETAPYMHDGSLETLADVIRFYERGGGPGAERLVPFALSASERADLIAFLAAL